MAVGANDDYVTLGILVVVVITGMVLAQIEGLTVYIVGTTVCVCIGATLLILLGVVSSSVYFTKKSQLDTNPKEFLGKSVDGKAPKQKRDYKRMGISY